MPISIHYVVAKLTHHWTYSTFVLEAQGKDEKECDEIAEQSLAAIRKEPGVKYAAIMERQVVTSMMVTCCCCGNTAKLDDVVDKWYPTVYHNDEDIGHLCDECEKRLGGVDDGGRIKNFSLFLQIKGDGHVDRYRYDNLTRQQCVELLEGVGIACYDNESDDVLREAVRVNVEDGTIPKNDLP